MSEVILKNISKRTPHDRYIVKDMNLSVKDKEFVVLTGPSGSGKTMTLRMIAGLEKISEGELWIDGELCNDVKTRKRDMAMVFQEDALYPHMDVYGNLAFSMQIRGISKEEIHDRVHEVSKMLGIERLLDRKPKHLTISEKHRVALGTVMMRRPKVVLVDKTISYVDDVLRNKMTEIHETLGDTVIYATHDQTEAMLLGTKIVVMNEGIVQQVATPERLYREPVNMFVAAFVGMPRINFFEAEIICEDKKVFAVFKDFPSVYRMWIRGLKGDMLKARYLNKTVIIGARPEDFYEQPDMSDTYSEMERDKLKVTIRRKEQAANSTYIYFENAERQFTAKLDEDVRQGVGDEIILYMDLMKVHFFNQETTRNIFYSEG